MFFSLYSLKRVVLMMLFYSNYCTSSKLLIDNIKRYDAMKYFKLINVEQYMGNGYTMPPQIHSVPAIMFIPDKNVLFGKQVFDYLLLPKKGFLLNLSSNNTTGESSTSVNVEKSTSGNEPMSFSLNSGTTTETFSFINETTEVEQKPYNWCGLNEKITIHTPEDTHGGTQTDDNGKKKMPDIAALRSQREMDIQQCTASVAPI